MKTPYTVKKNVEILRQYAKDASDAYVTHLTFGGKADREQEDYINALEDGANALALIQRLESQVPRWISVEKRMPEKGIKVLCLFKYPESQTVYENVYYGGGYWLSEYDKVTHWMPLPEPPKE